MRKWLFLSGASTLLLFLLCAIGPAKAAPASKTAAGTIVLVFKDGHRQTFNLADIERVEFPAAAAVAAAPSAPSGTEQPPRGRYFGKWEVGEGNGDNFFITLKEDGSAFRSLGDEHGKWAYVNGDALITWDDGAQDAIRKTGSRFQKYAYSARKSFTDTPDNVAPAHNTTPRPI